MSWLDQSYMGRKGVARGVAGVGAVFGHGLSSRKPGSDSTILRSSPVHPQGCTPLKDQSASVQL